MASRFQYIARVKCMCGAVVVIRTIGSTYGASAEVPCWKCARTVGFNGSRGFVIDRDGQEYNAPCEVQSWQIK
jgi:hypothetical protein